MTERPFDLLNDSIGNKVLVNLRNGREVTGKLEAFDQHMNLVVSNAMELQDGERKQKLGKVILRGDNIFYVSA